MRTSQLTQIRARMIKLGFDVFAGTGAHHLVRPLTGGRGFILMLHRVLSQEPRSDFNPNGFLAVQADYLSAALSHIKAGGWEFVSLDEAARLICDRQFDKRFCAITLDDGYRDNYTIAKPIFEAFKAPYTIYTATGFLDNQIAPWWLLLEELMAAKDMIRLDDGAGRQLDIAASDLPEKQQAFGYAVDFIRRSPEVDQLALLYRAASEADCDLSHVTDGLFMTWDQVRDLSDDALGSIGGHTIHHRALARLTCDAARGEVLGGLDRLQEMTGKRPRHFAYPYGAAAAAAARDFELLAHLNLATAVTTRPGLLFPGHDKRLTALPRVSLNGDYQSIQQLDILLSGAAFFLYNGFRRVVPPEPVLVD